MKRNVSILLLLVMLINTLANSLVVPQVIAEAGAEASGMSEKTIIHQITFSNEAEEMIELADAEGLGEINITWATEGIEEKESYVESVTLPDNIFIAEEITGDIIPQDSEEIIGDYTVDTKNILNIYLNDTITNDLTGTFSFNVEGIMLYEEKEGEEEDRVEETEGEQGSSDEDDVITDDTESASLHSEEEIEEEANQEELEDEQSTAIPFGITEATLNITEDFELNTTVLKDGLVLENGTELVIEAPYSDTIIDVIYDFRLVNGHNYGGGASYTISLPDMFVIPQLPESDAQDLAGPSGLVYGTYHTEGNDIIIIFNDTITTESNINGQIMLSANIDDQYDGPAEGDRIVFPFDDGDALEFPIFFRPDENGLDKTGIGNRGYNTEVITWTIDVNKNLQSIEGAELSDAITTGDHTFISDSFKIYKLTMNADGSYVEPLIDVTDEVLNEEFQLDFSDDNQAFSLEMGTINSAYRVVYETTINDSTGNAYSNGAALTDDDDLQLSTNATVAVSRGLPLTKEAINYNDVNQSIDWEVKYNYDEKVIDQEDAILTDVFGNANQLLDESSMQVYQVTIDPDTGEELGQELFTAYTLTLNDDGYIITFNETLTSAFKIYYTTSTLNRIEDDETITNAISDEFGNSSEGSQVINQGILIKNNVRADFEEKTTDWSILINRDEEVMQDVVLTDTLPEGFTFEVDSMTITGYDGDYTVEYNDDFDEVTITFAEDIVNRVTVSYVTAIDFNLAGREHTYTNGATVEWLPDGSINRITKTGSATFTPDQFTINNGFKYGEYDIAAKEITWTIGVNYNHETLSNATVDDVILGNQHFDLSDLRIYDMILTPEANDFTLGSEVTDFLVTGDSTGFNVEFGNISTGYVIIYTTSFEGELINNVYDNVAIVSSDNQEDTHLEASVSPRFGGEFTTKNGAQNLENGRIVNWRVNVNYSQSTLTNLVITDTPSINQAILRDSITLYGTTATQTNISKNPDLILEEGVDYTVSFSEEEDGQETYEITFIGDKATIDRAYVLEYDTYILYEGNGNISNDLTISGEQVAENTGGSSVNQAINFNRISGSIRGEVGPLTIMKVDAEDNALVLEGATFNLYDETGDILLRTGSTDEEGRLSFVNLLYGDYYLTEIDPPAGYAIDRRIGDTRRVTVGGESSGDNDTPVLIENFEIKRDVRLSKIDGTTGEELSGVSFELYRSDDTLVNTFVTDSAGELYVEDLLPGTYYFIESEPIEHYQENTTVYPFVIKDEHIILDIEADALTVENELIPGSATLMKIDADKVDTTNNGLEGATFLISSTDPEVFFERVVMSDNEGLIETGDLRPGLYVIEEVSAPYGFELASEDPIAFEIVRSQEEPLEIQAEPYANYVKTTSISLTKTDGISGRLLEGARFNLAYVSGDYTLESDIEGVTDQNGEVIFSDLMPGTYSLIELEAPSGYLASNELVLVTVTSEDVHNEQLVTIEIENDPFAEISLVKIDSDTGTPLSGAIFAVEDLLGNQIPGYESLQTDEQGNLRITGLPAGDYRLAEVQAPQGYTIQDGGFEYDFTVDASVTETESIEIEEVGNDIVRGGVRLVKIDAETGEPLEDVEFSLRANDLVNGGVYDSTTHVTDSNGEVIVEGLRPGTYTFYETRPLEGYQAYLGEIEFEIAFPYEDVMVELEVENHELIAFEVVKDWNDFGDEDRRPNEIAVELIRNGVVVSEVVLLNENNGWAQTFENLDAVDANGDFYVYTINEVNPGESYLLQGIEGDQDTGFTITNVETRSVEVEKIWLDDQDRFSLRPSSVEVQLKRDGDALGLPVSLSGPDWSYEFHDLPALSTNGDEYTYSVEELSTSISEHYEWVEVTGNQEDGFEIVNRITGLIDIPLTKEWLDTEETSQRPSHITIDLYQKRYDEEDFSSEPFEVLIIEPNLTGDWEGTFNALPQYDAFGFAFDYHVVENEVDGYSAEIVEHDGHVFITNTRANEIEIIGNKIWHDSDETERPVSITINLLQSNGETEIVFDTIEVTEDDGWSYRFDAVPEFDEEGSLYHYRVAEQDVPGYAVAYEGYDVINTRAETRNIEVTKGWIDDNNPDRPDEVTVSLFANQEIFSTVIIEAEEDWTYVFEDLAAYDGEGQPISYHIEEHDVEGYLSTIDGFNITNLRAELTALPVSKVWRDDNNVTGDRPDQIEVQLFRSDNVNEAYRIIELNAEENWQGLFSELPVFDTEGRRFSYSIQEVPVEGYRGRVEMNNFESATLVNTRAEQINIHVTKAWLDEGNQNLRPDEITVELYRNDQEEPLDAVTIVDAFGNWEHTFTEWERFDESGVEYQYRISEQTDTEFYELKEITGNALNGYTITNVRVGEVAIEGVKSWRDDNEEDRPERIRLNLIQTLSGNPVVHDTMEVTAEDNWEYQFAELPEFSEDGERYVYTIAEQDVPGYASSVHGFNVLNTRTELRDIEVTKGWLDANATNRPNEISVTLFANGEEYEEVFIKSEDGWSYTFKDLQTFDAFGSAIAYHIEESPVEGYQSIISGFNITNLRQESFDIELEKQWLDNDQLEVRPDQISVNLYRSDQPGLIYQSAKLEAIGGEWKHTFTELERFDSMGNEYVYSVNETELPEGYTLKSITGNAIEGFIITNLRTDMTSISGQKSWENDTESDRPESITLELYQNGILYDILTVDHMMNWSYQRNDLPQFDEFGVENIYTIEERSVDGYETIIDGFNIINRKVESEVSEENENQHTPLPNTATDLFNRFVLGLSLILFSMLYMVASKIKKHQNEGSK